jgi:hypothetical protein
MNMAFVSSQAWIILTMIGMFFKDDLRFTIELLSPAGILAGTLAAFIDIASEWLSDLKFGYCADHWYLNREFCCKHAPSTASLNFP